MFPTVLDQMNNTGGREGICELTYAIYSGREGVEEARSGAGSSLCLARSKLEAKGLETAVEGNWSKEVDLGDGS